MLTSIKKLIGAADESYKAGDEENAYMLYGRYVNLVFQLQKKPDYYKQKEYVTKSLGGNTAVHRILDRLQDLKASLIMRYAEQNGLNETAQLTIHVPSPPEVLVQPKGNRHSISCVELKEMMEKEASKFIILDVRAEADFEQSKINFNFVCNVPEKLACLGMSENKVKEKLPNSSKVIWELRKNRSVIVFLDWFSTSFIRNSPIWHLKNILMEWDMEIDNDKKPEMIVLEGGYGRWLTTYPMKCTDPKVQVPNASQETVPSMDGIEYPNFEDIAMKDSKGTPAVDRSTKSNALKNYEPNLSQGELLERKDHLMNKSLQNDKDLLKLETDYTNILSNKENEEDPAHSQNVLFQILELRSKQKDVDIERETIDEVIKTAPVKPSELSKVEDLENRLKEKEKEKKKVQPALEMQQSMMEEALKRARESKPDFNKTPIKAPRRTELILSPRNLNSQNSIPHFDRASKPLPVSNQNFYDNQDFAPVRGTVVSEYFPLDSPSMLAMQFFTI